MRDLPYPDESFGSVVAMGSPEHVLEGPAKVFREFFRVMKPGGVAVITVPHYFSLRAFTMGLFREPARRFKRNSLVRGLLGKAPLAGGNSRSHSDVIAERYRKDIHLSVDFDGHFYEYFFTKDQIQEELVRAGFLMEKCFAFNGEAGLIFSLGRLAGRYDRKAHRSHLTWFGRSLLKMMSDDGAGHMICSVVRKPA